MVLCLAATMHFDIIISVLEPVIEFQDTTGSTKEKAIWKRMARWKW